MKTLIVLTSALILSLCSCISSLEENEVKGTPVNPGKPIDVENAVYHEITKSWIMWQNDPYTLENFKNAYDNILSGNSELSLTRSQLDEISSIGQLKATHYSVKIYPRDEKEQSKFEAMEDISVVYIPFNYVFVPDSLIKKTRSEAGVFTDDSALGNATRAAANMPILYAVWPCDKPFLKDMVYEIEYEVFIPNSAAQTRSYVVSSIVMGALEDEAISLALGSSAVTSADNSYYLKGQIMQWDRFLDKNVPLSYLTIKYRVGSYVGKTYTRPDGAFIIYGKWPASTQVSYSFEYDNAFKVTTEDNTVPVERFIRTFGTPDGGKYSPISVFIDESDIPTMQQATIHRAAAYYYTNAPEIPKRGFEPTRICAIPQANNNGRAVFNIPGKGLPYLAVFNNDPRKQNLMIGTVFHELGHVIHYCEIGGASQFMEVEGLIRESFANYIGWHLGEKYYHKYMGYKRLWDDQDVTEQGKQKWSKTSTSDFTPLFIDLEDDCNQSLLYGNLFPRDAIKDVPPSVIIEIGTQSKNWAECKKRLQKYAGIYYSYYNLDKFTADYDYWYSQR